MKLLILLFLVPLSLFGQDFAAVDKLAITTPPGKTISIKTLSEYLCAGQPDDAHKARAIYAWVTLNIAYVDSTDEKEVWATPQHLKRQDAAQVLQNRSAVCEGYAKLFCALAAEAGISCEVVTGLVKTIDGKVEQIGHAWAVARIDGEWHLFDPTWGVPSAGGSHWKVMDAFFMVEPEQFVLKHLPDDPVWQLLENPITERCFRSDSDQQILDYVGTESAVKFNFRDTLSAWFLINPVQRTFASESRVLHFNGSNERVIFGLGQSYWGLFFELLNTLDSLTDEAIMEDTLEIDTTWFLSQIDLMNRYHLRSRALFEKLESPERVEKKEKFYTPQDVAALMEKLRGDMRSCIFEYKINTMRAGVLDEEQIAELRYQANLANQSYRLAEREINCEKMEHHCFDIRHNRSLLAIKLGQRQVRFAQDLADDKTASKNIQRISTQLREARALLLQAIEDCELMRRRPPRFTFVDERIITARQELLTLRSCEIRSERVAISPDLEVVLTAQKLSPFKAEKMAEKMSVLTRSMEGLQDTLQSAGRELGHEFTQIALFNLQLEKFVHQFNFANLRYRMVRNHYDNAVSKNILSNQRSNILSEGNLAVKTLRDATAALDLMELSGRLPASMISQKRLQVSKLNKALKEFLSGF